MRSTKYIYRGLKILLLSLLSLLYACSSEKVEELIENIDTLEEEIVEEIPVTEIEEPTPINSSSMFPASDPNNTGDWVLNTDISDEFEDSVLDETKWLVQGRNDEFKSNFKGRAPSQFSTDNFRNPMGTRL